MGLAEARERLRRARLYLVVDAAAEHVLPAALRGGVDMVQLRDKELDDDSLLEAAARFRAACREHDALFWLNDRPDLALAAGADGVHVGQDDASPGEVREEVGEQLLIGLSTHSPEQFDAALASEADQLSVGPVGRRPRSPAGRRPGSTTCATRPPMAASGRGSRSAASTRRTWARWSRPARAGWSWCARSRTRRIRRARPGACARRCPD